MAAVQTVGNGHRLPADAAVLELRDEYVIDLDVETFRLDDADFEHVTVAYAHGALEIRAPRKARTNRINPDATPC